MPGSAAFFVTYESIKRNTGGHSVREHVMASACGETVACTVRVPTEVCLSNRHDCNISLRIF